MVGALIQLYNDVSCDPYVAELDVTLTGLVTMMLAVGRHPFRGLTVRIWQRLSAHKLSTSSAMTGGRHSVHSMRLRSKLRPSLLFESKKR